MDTLRGIGITLRINGVPDSRQGCTLLADSAAAAATAQTRSDQVNCIGQRTASSQRSSWFCRHANTTRNPHLDSNFGDSIAGLAPATLGSATQEQAHAPDPDVRTYSCFGRMHPTGGLAAEAGDS